MGRTVQTRIVRRLDLEIFLSQIEPHPSPAANLEQYTISINVAATMLHIAAHTFGDISGKRVLDLGCGTGRLALGAAFLGAKKVVGLDIDKTAVKKAVENSAKMGLEEKVEWIVADVGAVHGRFDTVLQNPPFGVQRHTADRQFLEKALEAGKVAYSLHKGAGNDELLARLGRSGGGIAETVPSAFLKRYIEDRGGRIRGTYAMVMEIPRLFGFHTKKKHAFLVDLYIIEGEQTCR